MKKIDHAAAKKLGVFTSLKASGDRRRKPGMLGFPYPENMCSDTGLVR
jgi:hypothetical protein